MTGGVPGRIASIVNIHNPSIELHRVPASMNTGAAVIVVAGGGHNTLNVGSEGSDFVPFFYNYGINTIILRNRLRRDGYDAEIDAVNDMLQAIKVVRAYAEDWGIDPKKIGAIGFSAGAELTAPAAIKYRGVRQDTRRRRESAGEDQLAAGFRRADLPGADAIPRRRRRWRFPDDAPPSFIASGGVGDASHAIWADEYFAAFLRARIPNLEMHIYGNGRHPGTRCRRGATMTGGLTDRNGIPLGTWQFRFIDWVRDLGFLQKPGMETKAARDVAARVANPPRGRGGSALRLANPDDARAAGFRPASSALIIAGAEDRFRPLREHPSAGTTPASDGRVPTNDVDYRLERHLVRVGMEIESARRRRPDPTPEDTPTVPGSTGDTRGSFR